MADSIDKNKKAFKEQYPNEPDDVILAWATIKYNEDVYEETIAYKEKRQKAHASIGDQLDMLWHDINEGKLDKTGAWFLAAKEVKDNNPKPGE